MKDLLLPAVLLLSACSSSPPPITDCEPRGNIVPVCGMQTPEDIAAVPDGRHLLLAHFGHMGESSGSLSLFDTRTDSLRTLYPLPGAQETPQDTADWGDPECTSAPDATFSPHGTHLHQLADGRWRYLVVNHGNREAVELFELLLQDEGARLVWRGCVHAAGDAMMNDVVGLDNGDLVYSRMFAAGDSLSLAKAMLGFSTGELWRWNADTGLTPLPETAAAYPNGLEISDDNRHVFANMYMEQEVWKVDLADGSVAERYPVANADNSSWGPDGRLWIATHTMGLGDMVACFTDQSEPCPGAFAIVALDTDSGSIATVFRHEGPPMGAATVAVPQAGRVYMGSFAGDRMISVPEFGRPKGMP